MQLLDGKLVAESIYKNLEEEVAKLKSQNIVPKLAIVIVGKDDASLSYIRSKRKAAEKIGVQTELLEFSESEMTTEKLVALVHKLNDEKSINGILVQLPLPKHIYAPEVIKAITPSKDVDGFTAYNLGKMFLSTEFENLASCTPLGIIRMLEYYKIEVEGKDVVMVGASNIVGKPMAIMLLNRGATVTICHIKTKNLKENTLRADMVIVAVGKQNLITADMVKEGAIVIDVGINKTAEGKLVGDTDFENLSKKVAAITPVPGGCGLTTVAALMENLVKATKRQNNIN